MYRRRPFLVTIILALLALGLIWGCASDDDNSTEPETGPCSLSVIDPLGGETYYSQTVEYILWESQYAGDQVKIELLQADTLLHVIENQTDNDGSTSWTVTTEGNASASNYAIKVTSGDDSGCSAQSDTFIIIKTEDCEINVLIPDEDDTWIVGDTETIEWYSEDTAGSVNIDLYKLFEGTPTPLYRIAENAEDTGTYRWNVFACHVGGESQDYQIRVQDTANLQCVGFSEFFSIDDPDPCEIQVSQPALDEDLVVGEQYVIEWHGGDESDDLNIYLQRPGLSDAIISLGVPNTDHSYEWTVDLMGSNPAEGFAIYIEVADDPCCNGTSAPFEISLP